jgi:hypothetical protein
MRVLQLTRPSQAPESCRRHGSAMAPGLRPGCVFLRWETFWQEISGTRSPSQSGDGKVYINALVEARYCSPAATITYCIIGWTNIEPRGEGYDLQSTCGESGAPLRIRRIALILHRSQYLCEQPESWILGTACTTGRPKPRNPCSASVSPLFLAIL